MNTKRECGLFRLHSLLLCSLFILQGVLDLIPEALALDLVFVGRGLLELTQQLFLLVGEVLRDFDIDADILIAAAAAVDVRMRNIVPVWVPSGTLYSTRPSMVGT